MLNRTLVMLAVAALAVPAHAAPKAEGFFFVHETTANSLTLCMRNDEDSFRCNLLLDLPASGQSGACSPAAMRASILAQTGLPEEDFPRQPTTVLQLVADIRASETTDTPLHTMSGRFYPCKEDGSSGTMCLDTTDRDGVHDYSDCLLSSRTRLTLPVSAILPDEDE